MKVSILPSVRVFVTVVVTMKILAQVLALSLVVYSCQSVAVAQRNGAAANSSPRRGRPLIDYSHLGAKVEHYVSNMDGAKRPYGACSIGDRETTKPLVVLVQPGLTSDPNPDGLLRSVSEFGAIAKRHNESCVVIRPTGRGPGSRFQNYGEVDAIEALEDACKKYPIDRDRISVFGHSMGGAATWYLASHYPDLFACAAPLSGYCDHRLWDKAGGTTYHMHPFEEPSWQARSAAFLVENFEHTTIWIWHGERDRALGGGVPVHHARQMARLLKQEGFSVKYTEVPDEGHHPITPFKKVEMKDDYFLWMFEQKKVREPKHVAHAAYWLRHGKAYWVQIDQFQRYGERGLVDARLVNDHHVDVETKNIRALSLGPIAGMVTAEVEIDRQRIAAKVVDLSQRQSFYLDDSSTWSLGKPDLTDQKRLGVSGPISDIFFNEVIYVAGTTGSDDEAYYNGVIAGFSERAFRDTNGGLHRGGIPGQNTVASEVLQDSDMSAAELRQQNLILFGTDKSNSIVNRYIDRLPLEFGEAALRLGGKTYCGVDVAVLAVFPHPENPRRYVAVHGGVSPDAIVWGSHLHLLLLPDYIVYDRGKVLDWGFWNNDWRMTD